MLTKLRRLRSAAAARSAAGSIQVSLPPSTLALLEKLGARWQCSAEDVAGRVIMLAFTGWGPQHADVITSLSRFVPGSDDPFRRTCLMLKQHFDAAESELGESVKEHDRIAWLEMLLETLRTLRAERQPARLGELLAGNGLGAGLSA